MALLKRHVESFVDKRVKQFSIDAEWDQKVREQASKVAEYLSIAGSLDKDDPPEKYQRANQLSWELAMFLPAAIYRSVTKSISVPSELNNPFTALLEVRAYLIGDKLQVLTPDDVAGHAPNIRERIKAGGV
ncbi:MAG: hypothetical protein EON58_00710 [Alphaproteobacteria bacterium]|nr:MAG: hypothetical protein EON58_00710 [Alphaproteobacteria bacterium]